MTVTKSTNVEKENMTEKLCTVKEETEERESEGNTAVKTEENKDLNTCFERHKAQTENDGSNEGRGRANGSNKTNNRRSDVLTKVIAENPCSNPVDINDEIPDYLSRSGNNIRSRKGARIGSESLITDNVSKWK